jgi:hypothetical protein
MSCLHESVLHLDVSGEGWALHPVFVVLLVSLVFIAILAFLTLIILKDGSHGIKVALLGLIDYFDLFCLQLEQILCFLSVR